MFSVAALIHARLSFKQILLVVSYVLLESSLLASIGNTGQIQDLLVRQEEDWNPQIGEETYPDMIRKGWSATSRGTRQARSNIHQYMTHQNLIDATVSPSNLRVLLGQLLFRIEQMSVQGFNAVQHRTAMLNLGETRNCVSEEGSAQRSSCSGEILGAMGLCTAMRLELA